MEPIALWIKREEGNERKCKEMREWLKARWAMLPLLKEETLKCDICGKWRKGHIVWMRIDSGNICDVLCDDCKEGETSVEPHD